MTIRDLRRAETLVVLTTDFTHPVLSAQEASGRLNRSRQLRYHVERVIIFCVLGRHVGSPLSDFLLNLRPAIKRDGNVEYVFPPVLRAPKVGTLVSLLISFVFLCALLVIRRINLYGMYATSIYTGALGSFVKAIFNSPLVVDYGDPEFLREKGIVLMGINLSEKLVIGPRRADAFIYLDQTVRSYLSKKYGISNAMFIPPGGYSKLGVEDVLEDSKAIRESLSLGGKKIVLYAGHVAPPPYRLDLLIGSAPLILKEHEDARFLIVGAGSMLGEMIKEVGVRNLSKYFVFTGPVPYARLRPYLALADVAVNLLEDMCLGTKVVNYFACGRAVVATGRFYAAYDEFLLNNRNCILVQPNPTALATAINHILKNPDIKSRLQREALETVRPYDWDSEAKLIVEAISRSRRWGKLSQ